MNARTIRYAAVGLGLLVLLIVGGWLVLRETATPSAEAPAAVTNAPLHVHRFMPPPLPAEDTTPGTPATPTDDAAATNAATLYRQAFALFDNLSKEEKDLSGNWWTNVDETVET